MIDNILFVTIYNIAPIGHQQVYNFMYQCMWKDIILLVFIKDHLIYLWTILVWRFFSFFLFYAGQHQVFILDLQELIIQNFKNYFLRNINYSIIKLIIQFK